MTDGKILLNLGDYTILKENKNGSEITINDHKNNVIRKLIRIEE